MANQAERYNFLTVSHVDCSLKAELQKVASAIDSKIVVNLHADLN